MINYYVIGGQYEYYNHGGAATLTGAKRIATKNLEMWDNWQGPHKPSIYAAADCITTVNFYGEQLTPRPGAAPVAVWDDARGKWINPAED